MAVKDLNVHDLYNADIPPGGKYFLTMECSPSLTDWGAGVKGL